MLEAYLSDGKIYFLPSSIFMIKLAPISYKKGDWRMIFVDHNNDEHALLEGTLGKCCEMLEGLNIDAREDEVGLGDD